MPSLQNGFNIAIPLQSRRFIYGATSKWNGAPTLSAPQDF
jgi:hypothetical protein